jgi:hypothetical protein
MAGTAQVGVLLRGVRRGMAEISFPRIFLGVSSIGRILDFYAILLYCLLSACFLKTEYERGREKRSFSTNSRKRSKVGKPRGDGIGSCPTSKQHERKTP